MSAALDNVLDINERLRKKSISDVIGQMGEMQDKATSIIDEYTLLMKKDQIEAVKRLPEFVSKSRHINNIAYEGMAGGPNQDWIAPMFNVLGSVYQDLNKDARKMGLQHIMNFLDHLRYDYSQNHVELIDDPWLVGDIVGNRGLYWPGVESYFTLFEKHKTWDELSVNLKYVKSQFFFAFAVTRPKHSSLDIRTNFYKKFPELVDKTADGIIARIALGTKQMKKHKDLDVEKYVEECIVGYDPLLHDKLRIKYKEEKWVDLDFN